MANKYRKGSVCAGRPPILPVLLNERRQNMGQAQSEEYALEQKQPSNERAKQVPTPSPPERPKIANYIEQVRFLCSPVL